MAGGIVLFLDGWMDRYGDDNAMGWVRRGCQRTFWVYVYGMGKPGLVGVLTLLTYFLANRFVRPTFALVPDLQKDEGNWVIKGKEKEEGKR